MGTSSKRRGIVPRAYRAVAARVAVLALLQFALLAPSAARGGEVRALWVARSTLTSPAAITEMVASARASRFNTLVVQVRGRGDAYFDGMEPRAAALGDQPRRFDPLERVLVEAHRAGLQVHAWINVNFVWDRPDLPASRHHVVRQHPEWLMVPRVLAPDLARVDPRRPEYVRRLISWTRSQSATVEGLYLSPIDPDATRYTIRVVEDLVSHYAIDGLHLDYVRYPADQFDYSRHAIDQFRRAMAPRLAARTRKDLDALARRDPLAYPDRLQDAWASFRRDRLTSLVRRVRAAALARRPRLLMSAAVVPDATDASKHRLQDWRTWLDQGLLDIICPMAYTADSQLFTTQIAHVRSVAGALPVWAGIGAYRLSPAQTLRNISIARRLGTDGIILFSYDSLTSPPHDPSYLSDLGRLAFGR